MKSKDVFLKMGVALLIVVIGVACLNGGRDGYYHYSASQNISSKTHVNVLEINFCGLFDMIKNLFGGGSSSKDSETVKITSNNVCKFIKADTSGKKKVADYCSENNLSANIYRATNSSSSWALLVHGNTMSGSLMYSAVGKMYTDNNINVLAIDLRGFGNSKGSVALGFLESLDVMDWLDYLNQEEKAKKIVIHGVSLGGATTIQTLTMGGLSVDGIGTMPSISSKNVVGVVDDCGYTSMTGIITEMLPGGSSNKEESSESFDTKSQSLFGSKFNTGAFGNLKTANISSILSVDNLVKTVLTGNLIKTGLNSVNYDLYQNALGSNRTADSNVKVQIIHGQSDTTVSPDNAKRLESKVGSNLVDAYYPKSAPHAFIVVGMNKDEYTKRINNFINKVNLKDSSVKVEENNSNSKKDTGILGFFKNLFSK